MTNSKESKKIAVLFIIVLLACLFIPEFVSAETLEQQLNREHDIAVANRINKLIRCGIQLVFIATAFTFVRGIKRENPRLSIASAGIAIVLGVIYSII